DQYRDTIASMLAGHTHMDYFRMGFGGEIGRSSAFLLVTPGISPIFGNNPGLHVISYDRKAFSFLDYTTYRLDLAVGPSADWKVEYSFSRTYGLFPISATGLETLSRSLKDDAQTRATYIDYYNVGNPANDRPNLATLLVRYRPTHFGAFSGLRGKVSSALSHHENSESRNNPQRARDRHEILQQGDVDVRGTHCFHEPCARMKAAETTHNAADYTK